MSYISNLTISEIISNLLLLLFQRSCILYMAIGIIIVIWIINIQKFKNVLVGLRWRKINSAVGFNLKRVSLQLWDCNAIARKAADLALKLVHEELEIRVAKRTAELKESNDRLQAELLHRQGVEVALHKANEQLSSQVQELETRNREIALLIKLSDFLQSCLTTEEFYQAIAHFVEPIFPEISGGVFIMDTSKNRVEASVTWGDSALTSQTSFAPNECWALRRERLHIVEPNPCALRCTHIESAFRGASLCAPLRHHGNTVGMLYLYSLQEKPFTIANQQLASGVAEQIALALANLKIREALRQQSISDPLTGLYNRRYLKEFLEQELRLAHRQHSCLGVIIADVDHFKRFNDTFGHEAGDIVLREIGLFLKQQVRRSDVACRYGGEEFLLILPETSLELCSQRAEQVCQNVRHLDLHYQNQPLGSITLSLGVAIFPVHGLTVETVIQAADVALYQAKQLGRNRVVIANTCELSTEETL
jgi:diguanylate cyclase (GGDEF)-like protein